MLKDYRKSFFILSIMVLTGIMLLASGCKSGSKTDKAEDELENNVLPKGFVGPGEISLLSMKIKVDLPVKVYGQVQQGQWLANTEEGTFRIAAALFDSKAKDRNPKVMIETRMQSLVKVYVEPSPISPGILTRLNAQEGYVARHSRQQSGNGNTRKYYIFAVKFSNNNVLMISLDALEQSYADVDEMFIQFVNTITPIGDEKSGNDSTSQKE